MIGNKPEVLVLAGVPDSLATAIGARFRIVDGRTGGVLAVPPEVLARVEGIACTGRAVVGTAELDALPSLRVVSSYSAGLDGIDESALGSRGIPLYNTSHVLAGAVADLATASMLTLMRGIVQADRFVRDGKWKSGAFPLVDSVQGRRVGILGFGHIGKHVARRCAAFDMEVAYCAKTKKRDRPELFFESAEELAGWADVLVIACSSTPQTRGLVDTRILSALGSKGILVNVARGVIVDESALLEALNTAMIAGAALDVFTKEPDVPYGLLELPNVLLTPHIGSGTWQTRQQMEVATLNALDRHLLAA